VTIDIDDSALTSRYDGMRRNGAHRLLTASYEVEPQPEMGSERWGLSAVLRPAGPLAEKLVETCERLDSARRGPHFAYDMSSLHVTVRSMTSYSLQYSDDVVLECVQDLREVASSSREVRIRLEGVAVASAGIIACGYPSRELLKIRHVLLERAKVRAHDRGYPAPLEGEGPRIRDSAHASLMVFRGTSIAEPEVAHILQGSDAHVSGALSFEEIELVQFRVKPHDITLQVLETIRLG